MSASPVIPPSGKRCRGSVEVYFLLYLSAIILLLGTTQGRNDSDDLQDTVLELLAPGFRVEAEKPALVWRFVPAGLSVDSTRTPLEQDSTNIITAYGTVDDLRFAIIEIEDTLSGSTLPSESATLTRVGERSAVFRWQPTAGEDLENRVYRVTVSATGRPIPRRDLTAETRRRIISILERGGTVGDSVTFTVNLLSINTRGGGVIVQTPSNRRPDEAVPPLPPDTVFRDVPPADPRLPSLDIQVASTFVEAESGRRWNNRVTVTGEPGGEIVWNVPSSVRMITSSNKSITLEGITPASGSEQRVAVSARRSSDGATATASFTVAPASDDRMRIPETMYIGQEYNLDVGGTGGSGERSEVTILLNNQPQGTFFQKKIPFRPTARGQAEFIRKINGIERSRRTASILPLPTPRIAIAEQSDNEVIVQTSSFGSIRGNPNMSDLNILQYNAADPVELVERRRDNDRDGTTEHIQFWRIRPKEAGAFVFTMQAIDLRGSGSGKSAIVSYPR